MVTMSPPLDSTREVTTTSPSASGTPQTGGLTAIIILYPAVIAVSIGLLAGNPPLLGSTTLERQQSVAVMTQEKNTGQGNVTVTHATMQTMVHAVIKRLIAF